jgi:DNA-binding CsgD family transcriptional regulator
LERIADGYFATEDNPIWIDDDGTGTDLPFSRLIDRFAEMAGACASDRALRALLADMTAELGFRYFALLHHASLGAGGASLVRIDNYPAGWEEELVSGGLVADDPVHLASARTNVGFCWSELGGLIRLTRRHRDILERSGRHGIGPGFTIPANVPGEPSGSCSFATASGRNLPVQRLLCAEQIGAHAFRAARRIHDYPAAGAHPHLSRRELQCLHLLAAGKSDWEIAAILRIGVDTVHQYVKHARAAYDVVSRTQLVVHGLRDSWISFGDAIPPNG